MDGHFLSRQYTNRKIHLHTNALSCYDSLTRIPEMTAPLTAKGASHCLLSIYIDRSEEWRLLRPSHGTMCGHARIK